MRIPGAAGVLAILAMCCLPHAARAAATQCTTKPHSTIQTCFVDSTIDPMALCNDGTVPAFWYRPGSGSGINEWIIWLGGGGNCDSGASCAIHVTKKGVVPYFISSNGFQATPGKGITSADPAENPSLYSANTVYLHYCSSDTWAGNILGVGTFNVNDSSTWDFEGHRIAIAQVKALTALLPALANAAQIIIGGDSSGGVGVVEVANEILPLLPSAASKLLVSDAGFTLNIGQYDHHLAAPYVYPDHPNAFEADLQERLSYWGAHGDIVCDATAITPTDHANCYNTAYVLQNRFIKVPSFVATSLLDTSQVTLELCPGNYGYCPFSRDPTSPQGIYATAFGSAMANLVVGAGTAETYVAYAPDLYTHVILNDNSAFKTPHPFAQGNIAPRDVFDAWLANPSPQRVHFIGTGPGVQ